MCLVLACSTGFLATEMAEVESHIIGILPYSKPKSLKVDFIHKICEQQEAVAIYSASVVESDTQFCLRDDQLTKNVPRNWQVPDVDL